MVNAICCGLKKARVPKTGWCPWLPGYSRRSVAIGGFVIPCSGYFPAIYCQTDTFISLRLRRSTTQPRQPVALKNAVVFTPCAVPTPHTNRREVCPFTSCNGSWGIAICAALNGICTGCQALHLKRGSRRPGRKSRRCAVIIARPAPSATTDARAMQLNNGAHVSAPCYCRCLTSIWCLRYLTP